MTLSLFGFGAVGQGLYELATRAGHTIPRIAIRDASKTRSLPANRFTTDLDELLAAPTDAIVEAVSELDAGLHIVRTALQRGIPVASASKKMLAHHLPELLAISQQTGATLRYEAACAGAIPIVDGLDRYFAQEPIRSLRGILNGTTNYILTQMMEQGQPYAVALQQAQALGFAEADPSADVLGWDARHKLVLLTVHAFGRYVAPADVLTYGIDTVGEAELALAQQHGLRVRLVAQSEEGPAGLRMSVLPSLVAPDDALYAIRLEQNAVVTSTEFAGTHLWTGPGAGSFPTGAALRFDLAQSTGYRYPKGLQTAHPLRTEVPLPIYLRAQTVPGPLWTETPQVIGHGLGGWTTLARLQAALPGLREQRAALLGLTPELLRRLVPAYRPAFVAFGV